MESTLAIQKHSKRPTTKTHDNISTNQQESNAHSSFSESIKQTPLHNLTPLHVTPVSPSPPPSITDETPSFYPTTPSISQETSSVFQTSSMHNQQTNEIENLPSNSNKRSHENSEYNYKIDEQLSPSKRSRHSLSSQDSMDHRPSRLTYEDIIINDMLLVKYEFNQKKQYSAKCIEKNNQKKELLVHYQGLDSK